MYYNLDAFNNQKLFLTFNGLHSAFIEKHKGENFLGELKQQDDLFRHYFLEFLYRAHCAYSFLDHMRALSECIATHFNDLKPHLALKNEQEVNFESFIVNEYLNYVMPFLNTLFVLQDRIMLIIAIYLDLKLVPPVQKQGESGQKYRDRQRRFQDAIQGFPTYVTRQDIFGSFPARIQQLAQEYWHQYGQTIRKYRNLDQHQYNLAEQTFYQLKSKERFVLLLPDNPEERNYDKLTYKKKIVAFDLFEQHFNAFHAFVEQLMRFLHIKPVAFTPTSYAPPNCKTADDYQEGDLMNVWVFGGMAILLNLGKDGPNGAGLHMRMISNRIRKITREIQ